MSDRLLEVLGSCVRATVAAPEGKTLVVCDWSSVEVWVLGWMTGCEGINKMAREKRDPYKGFAEIWLGVPYGQCDKVTRNLCKPPMLGSGYRLGPGKEDEEDPEIATGLMGYGRNMGVVLTQAQAEHATRVYRDTFWEVPENGWYACETAAFQAVVEGKTVEQGPFTWRKEGDFLTIRLPSGRKLFYHQPRWGKRKTPWGEERWGLSYMGKSQYNGQWCRLDTHGGKLVENEDQAVANEILRRACLRYESLRSAGKIVGHVHDEIIVEAPEDRAEEEKRLLEGVMVEEISWAQGLILGVEGYISKRFKKG